MVILYLNVGRVVFDPADGFFEQALDETGIVGNGDETDFGGLPHVVQVGFGGGQVEFFGQASQQGFEAPRFSLSESTPGKCSRTAHAPIIMAAILAERRVKGVIAWYNYLTSMLLLARHAERVTMSRALNALLVIGLLIIAALTGYGLVSTVQLATRPVTEAGNSFATQVAVVLPPTATPLPSGEAVVVAVRSLARLESASYVIEKVIIKEEGQGALGVLFGDRLIFVAHGEVIAGVDLGKMQVSDIQVLPSGKAYVVLPAPEVLVTNIDNDKSYVVDRQTGLLTKGSISLETEARREAEAEIEKAALEAGVLDRAQESAEATLRKLLASLGYTDVTFVRATPIPNDQ